MAIFTYISSSRGKCVSCWFYSSYNRYWLTGNCINDEAKIRRRKRQWNDKICMNWKRNTKRYENDVRHHHHLPRPYPHRPHRGNGMVLEGEMKKGGKYAGE